MQVGQPVQPECQQCSDGPGDIPDQCDDSCHPGHQLPLTPTLLPFSSQSGTVISEPLPELKKKSHKSNELSKNWTVRIKAMFP